MESQKSVTAQAALAQAFIAGTSRVREAGYLSCPIDEGTPDAIMFSGSVQPVKTRKYSNNPDELLHFLLQK